MQRCNAIVSTGNERSEPSALSRTKRIGLNQCKPALEWHMTADLETGDTNANCHESKSEMKFWKDVMPKPQPKPPDQLTPIRLREKILSLPSAGFFSPLSMPAVTPFLLFLISVCGR